MRSDNSYTDIIAEIAKEAQKLSPLEQEQFLIKVRLANYLKKRRRPVAAYNSRKLKAPSLGQIDKWKHDSRNGK
jgi:hypothetical protein